MSKAKGPNKYRKAAIENMDKDVTITVPETFFSPESSNIEQATYYPVSKQMEVVFKRGGRMYVYKEIPKDIWYEFKEAPSKGQYFSMNIRDRFNGVPQ